MKENEKTYYKGTKRKNRNSKKPKFTDVRENRKTDKPTNDPSWYTTNKDLVDAAASINFSQVLGHKMYRGLLSNPLPSDVQQAGLTVGEGNFAIPGIMTMSLMPALGYSKEPNSAVNIASNAIYSFIRHANSGHSNYDSNDLMIYLLANTQIYSYLNFLIRVYSCATLYSGANRYLPAALVQAQGVNYDDVINNLANFRFALDTLIVKAQSLAVPANMTIFARHAFLYTNVYAEGTSPKDQLYMYVPQSFWTFDLDTDGAGMLKQKTFMDDHNLHPADYHLSGKTVKELIQFGNELIDKLVTDEDFGIMSGDILKAYGQEAILKLNTVSQIGTLIPVFDPVVLYQFKNAKVVEMLRTTQGMVRYRQPEVVQSKDKSYLTCLPELLIGGYTPEDSTARELVMHGSDVWISSSQIVPSVEEVLESTRLSAVFGTPYTESQDDYVPVLCGTELAVECKIWTLNSSTGKLDWYAVSMHGNESATNVNYLGMIASLSNFKYAPEVMLFDLISAGSGEALKVDYYGSIFDTDNYSVQPCDVIARIHDAVLMNMLAVPSVASFNTVRKQ